MRLTIDTRNGLAGDIMAAGLIGLGADAERVVEAMQAAGNLAGKTSVAHHCREGIQRLRVDFEAPEHMHAEDARHHLADAIRLTEISEPWSGIANRILEAMIEAEGHVHSVHPALKRHYHGPEPVLHEASDILIDIVGASLGMMLLGITAVEYLECVNVGGGRVRFSHGTLDVPTPATRYILETHGIAWMSSDSELEMTTPTGASILAGCGAVRVSDASIAFREAKAGGTRPLPPVRFMLHQ
jgi:hypothetical protein